MQVTQLEDFSDGDRLFHMTFLLSLHLMGCTVCLRNRLLPALYQASNRQNHCKVRKESGLGADIALKCFCFTNEKRKDENNALCASRRNFPWWSLILNISFNMFHRKFLYIVDYLGSIMEMAPRFTEMYATEKYYYSHFLPKINAVVDREFSRTFSTVSLKYSILSGF